MSFRLAGTVKRLNIEHRTSNIEHRILMTLRFIDFKTNEPQNIEGWNRCALSFELIKIDKIPSFGLIHNSIQQFPAGGKFTNQFVCVCLCGSVAN